MTFEEVCSLTLANEEVVNEFNRLSGHRLGKHRTVIESAIDQSCGYDPDKEAIPDFIAFVFNFIWTPLLQRRDNGETNFPRY
jgi:hypothetical protein